MQLFYVFIFFVNLVSFSGTNVYGMASNFPREEQDEGKDKALQPASKRQKTDERPLEPALRTPDIFDKLSSDPFNRIIYFTLLNSIGRYRDDFEAQYRVANTLKLVSKRFKDRLNHIPRIPIIDLNEKTRLKDFLRIFPNVKEADYLRIDDFSEYTSNDPDISPAFFKLESLIKFPETGITTTDWKRLTDFLNTAQIKYIEYVWNGERECYKKMTPNPAIPPEGFSETLFSVRGLKKVVFNKWMAQQEFREIRKAELLKTLEIKETTTDTYEPEEFKNIEHSSSLQKIIFSVDLNEDFKKNFQIIKELSDAFANVSYLSFKSANSLTKLLSAGPIGCGYFPNVKKVKIESENLRGLLEDFYEAEKLLNTHKHEKPLQYEKFISLNSKVKVLNLINSTDIYSPNTRNYSSDFILHNNFSFLPTEENPYPSLTDLTLKNVAFIPFDRYLETFSTIFRQSPLEKLTFSFSEPCFFPLSFLPEGSYESSLKELTIEGYTLPEKLGEKIAKFPSLSTLRLKAHSYVKEAQFCNPVEYFKSFLEGAFYNLGSPDYEEGDDIIRRSKPKNPTDVALRALYLTHTSEEFEALQADKDFSKIVGKIEAKFPDFKVTHSIV